ncbi:autophagy-related protein 11-domain-containing protein [Elsinoe ampelina]|uniref:Autophagy-related protein 11 n=1 Tax=Elsinoe ampelina TaxID=302913 RepID=A0A6A6GKU3_9PEZI|nr:autophagy-related protein 11-domain-containing protein [Elsinoe ampelina]
MSLTLHHAHTGHSYPLDPSRLPNLDALRSHLVSLLAITPKHQVLLTAKGKSVRPQSLLTEPELFLFDAALLDPGIGGSTGSLRGSSVAAQGQGQGQGEVFLPDAEEVDAGHVPDVITRQDSLVAWRGLFGERLAWAKEVAGRCGEVARLAERAEGERGVIARGLGVALESLKIHIRGAETKVEGAGRWVEEIVRDQEGKLRGWEGHWGVLKGVRGRGDFAGFVQGVGTGKKEEVTLADILTRQKVEGAARQAEGVLLGLQKKVGDIKATLGQLQKRGDELWAAAEQMQLSSMEATEPGKLMEEIDIILRKITSDDNHVSTLPKTAQSVSQASKMALLHTRNYLPNMQEYAAEMNDLVRKAVQSRNNTAETCLQHMQALSRIESGLSRVLMDIKALDMPADDQAAFATLNVVSRLPFVYGSLLVEAVRRKEWIDKMKRDSGTLAEEMATYQEEESRRRQRWLNSIDDVIRPELAKSKALGIEVNLQTETEQWPIVSRQEIQEYIDQLVRIRYPEEVTQELTNALRTLDHPTKKQIKHAKAFRNGSMHEAAFGTTSLALRGEDDFKVIRDANAKLEEELRGQKSREKRLARRIVMLEAEVQSQRELREGIEREARDRAEAHARGKEEIMEAESVKKDIMQNMEAQQREFVAERRGLEQELTNVRGRVKQLEEELKKREVEKTKNVEEMRGNWLAEQERSRMLEDQLRDAMAAKEEADVKIKRLQALAEQQKQAEQENLAALSAVHMHLSPGTETPEKYTSLVVALEDLARRSAAHVKDLAEAVALAKSENESLLLQHQVQTTELSETRKKQSDAEDELARMQEQVSSGNAKAESLSSQLDAEREQLKSLRSKFAEGETGADSLRQRVEEQEREVGRLSEQLAESKSHVNSLDVELMRVQNKLNAATATAESAQNRLDVRSARAKDLSQRLFAQNARLLRLLESLGFAVSHNNGNMVIERASKVGASTTLTEPSMFLQRTVSLTSPPTTRKTSSALPQTLSSPPSPTSLSFLHWPDASSPASEETLYTALQSHLSLFNTDTFSDALAKRLRDFEYTARKFRLEARTASTKAARFATEAHTKLAVRDFKEGDLALFLPTKGKAVGAWAAFNINSPHHFLREREGMALGRREWLVARIQKVEERVVDLGRSLRVEDGGSVRSVKTGGQGQAEGDKDREEWLDSENPFDLSDGLTWYLVHATEERTGAPIMPGAGKVTVQGSLESARAEKAGRTTGGEGEGRGVKDLKEKLGKSLESRRSSSTSKRSGSASVKGLPIAGAAGQAQGVGSGSPRVEQSGLGAVGVSVSPARESEVGSPGAGVGQGLGVRSASSTAEEEQDKVRTDLLFGP